MSSFQRRIKGAKDHTPGKVRYFTYYLEFPDKETWVDQILCASTRMGTEA